MLWYKYQWCSAATSPTLRSCLKSEEFHLNPPNKECLASHIFAAFLKDKLEDPGGSWKWNIQRIKETKSTKQQRRRWEFAERKHEPLWSTVVAAAWFGRLELLHAAVSRLCSFWIHSASFFFFSWPKNNHWWLLGRESATSRNKNLLAGGVMKTPVTSYFPLLLLVHLNFSQLGLRTEHKTAVWSEISK